VRSLEPLLLRNEIYKVPKVLSFSCFYLLYDMSTKFATLKTVSSAEVKRFDGSVQKRKSLEDLIQERFTSLHISARRVGSKRPTRAFQRQGSKSGLLFSERSGVRSELRKNPWSGAE